MTFSKTASTFSCIILCKWKTFTFLSLKKIYRYAFHLFCRCSLVNLTVIQTVIRVVFRSLKSFFALHRTYFIGCLLDLNTSLAFVCGRVCTYCYKHLQWNLLQKCQILAHTLQFPREKGKNQRYRLTFLLSFMSFQNKEGKAKIILYVHLTTREVVF